MNCLDCGAEMRVKRTYPSGTDKAPTTSRVCACPCGNRYITEETIVRRLAISSTPVAHGRDTGDPPNGYRTAENSRSNGVPCDSYVQKGGSGGSLPSESGPSGSVPTGPLSALSDPDPSVGDQGVDPARGTALRVPFREPHRMALVGTVTPYFLAVYNRYPNKDKKSCAAQAWHEVAEDYPGGEPALRDTVLAWFDTGVLNRPPYAGEQRYRTQLEKLILERRWEDAPSDPDVTTAAPPSVSPYRKLAPIPPGVPAPPRPRP